MRNGLRLGTLGGTVALIGLAAACTTGPASGPAAADRPMSLIGAPADASRPSPYLTLAELPDGLTLIPPPPAAGSSALDRDQEGARQALALRGSRRWDVATQDAELFTATSTAAMACAAGRQIDASATPVTFRLLTRAAIDFSNSTASAKNKYNRPRPFMQNGQPSCSPAVEETLHHNGSYPSGHSAIGFGWGLVLAELMPERATALVARGRAFGDSRRVCNVHWLSDTEEGRVTATATFARLQASPTFAADLAAARGELAQVAPRTPSRDCAVEAAALAGATPL